MLKPVFLKPHMNLLELSRLFSLSLVSSLSPLSSGNGGSSLGRAHLSTHGVRKTVVSNKLPQIKIIWRSFGIVLELFWDRFGVDLELFWDRVGIIMGSILDWFGMFLRLPGLRDSILGSGWSWSMPISVGSLAFPAFLPNYLGMLLLEKRGL